MSQAILDFPAVLYSPSPLLGNQWPKVVMNSTLECYSCPISRSYPHTAPPAPATRTSQCGSYGWTLNPCMASIPNSITCGSTLPPNFYLTELRGVHIGNCPLETNGCEIRCLVTRTLRIPDERILDVSLPIDALGRQKGYALVSFQTKELAEFAKDALDGIIFCGNRLKVKTDQNWQTIYPSHPFNDSKSETRLQYQHNCFPLGAEIPQNGEWAPSYSAVAKTGNGGYSTNVVGQLSGASREPEFIEPLVVDGSKTRDLPKSSNNGERSAKEKAKEKTKEKVKKDRGSDLKGKHKKH